MSGGGKLQEGVGDFAATSRNLREMTENNRKRLDRALIRFERSATMLDSLISGHYAQIDSSLASIARAGGSAEVAADNLAAMSKDLKEIAARLRAGEGTAGRLSERRRVDQPARVHGCGDGFADGRHPEEPGPLRKVQPVLESRGRNPMNVVALIMAGGSGERFGAGTPKQLAPLGGTPMLAWSAAVFARSPRVTSLVLVGPAADEARLRAALPAEAQTKTHAYAAGGSTRQASVFSGLEAVPEKTTHVLIHDAARPCLSDALRDRVIDALGEHDAVVPAVSATDTLVRTLDTRVEGVVDRSHLAGVQTPQGFRLDLIVRAHRAAQARGLESSDDGSLVLALKEPVIMVAGERSNIKVTYRDDIVIAEAILKRGVRI